MIFLHFLSYCHYVSLRFSQRPTPGFVDFNVVLLVSTWLILALSLVISCWVLLLGLFGYFCPSAFRCSAKLIVYALSSFFFLLGVMAIRLIAMGFHLSTVFIMSHKFGYIVPSFSSNSKKSFIFSLFLPWLSYHLVMRCSASTCMWAFCYFCCYWTPVLVHGDLIGCIVLFQSSCICWDLFYDQLNGHFWRR